MEEQLDHSVAVRRGRKIIKPSTAVLLKCEVISLSTYEDTLEASTNNPSLKRTCNLHKEKVLSALHNIAKSEKRRKTGPIT